MTSKKGSATRAQVDRAVQMLARERAGLAGGHGRPSFGNLRREELSGRFGGGQSVMGALVPATVKPVPVILGTLTGVALNSGVGRLLESPAVGINANPLLSRVSLAVAGVLAHVLVRKDFTLGIMVGQLPGLIDAAVSAGMDLLLGEGSAMQGAGANMGQQSREALAELQALRRTLEGTPAPAAGNAQIPLALRARAAA